MQIYRQNDFFSRHWPINITRFRHSSVEYPPGNRDFHQREFWKIVYILQGEGIFQINGRDYRFSPGFLYLSHPDDLTTLELKKDIELYNILFRKDFIEHDLPRLYGTYNFFSVFRREFHPTAATDHELLHVMDANRKIGALLHRMEHEWNHEDANTLEMLHLQLLELLIELARNGEKNFSRKRRSELISYINHFLDTHFREKIDAGKLAQSIGISKGYLFTIYQRKTGVSFGKKLQQLRLNEFKQLLETSSEPVETICAASGFSDLCNLYKVFHRETGLTPGEFRRRHSR